MKLLLGSSYAPLREEFSTYKMVIRNIVKRIFLTTGGTDPYNRAVKVIRFFLTERNMQEDSNVQFCVISGKMNQNYRELQSLSEQYPCITVYSNVDNMAELMASCDIAVSAGGTLALDEQQIIPCAGDARDWLDNLPAKILEYLEPLFDSSDRRKQQDRRMNALIDGEGAKRIAEALLTWNN